MADRIKRPVNFDRRIERRWPDPEAPGWEYLQLECGHKSGAPREYRGTTAHCGCCVLESEARQIAERTATRQGLQSKIEAAAAAEREETPDAG